jgi:precorrin-3B synthase
MALPYGRCRAEAMDEAARLSAEFGRRVLRLAPWRGLAIPSVAPGDFPALMRRAEAAGFIVTPDDPRLAVAACPGAPDCTKGTTPTHRDADAIAAILAPSPRHMTVHVSGCAKGCAHPGPADLTLVGDGGIYEVVPGGGPRDKSGLRLPIKTILTRLSGSDPASAFSKSKP